MTTISENIWQYLTISNSIQQYVTRSNNIWQCLDKATVSYYIPILKIQKSPKLIWEKDNVWTKPPYLIIYQYQKYKKFPSWFEKMAIIMIKIKESKVHLFFGFLALGLSHIAKEQPWRMTTWPYLSPESSN